MKLWKKRPSVRFEDIYIGDEYSRHDDGIFWKVEEKDHATLVIKVRFYAGGKKTDLVVPKSADSSIFHHKKKS